MPNLAKRIIGIIEDLAIITKKKGPYQQRLKSRSNEKCLNCNKKGHYTRDCLGCPNSKKKPEDEKKKQEAKRER